MESDNEGYSRDNEITNQYYMKTLTNGNLQGRQKYVAPFVSETQIDVSQVLCSSPNSDFVEDMTTGDKFDNWI